MSFKDSSNWNEKNEFKAFIIFKKLEALGFPRGKQMEFCREMEKETNLDARNISAKVGNYKSVAGINNNSNASSDTKENYSKYKNYSIEELEKKIKKDKKSIIDIFQLNRYLYIKEIHMKKRLVKVVLALALLSIWTPSMADEYNSLFGIEIGSKIRGEEIQKSWFGNAGLKVGAESEDFRFFLNARYYNTKDKFITSGGEIQYKFNFTKYANIFFGLNAGLANIGITKSTKWPSVNANIRYLGADVGFNIHATELIDFEIGTRYMGLNKKVIQGYDFASLKIAYASVIFKWKTD